MNSLIQFLNTISRLFYSITQIFAGYKNVKREVNELKPKKNDSEKNAS
jgi:hypothetical protein